MRKPKAGGWLLKIAFLMWREILFTIAPRWVWCSTAARRLNIKAPGTENPRAKRKGGQRQAEEAAKERREEP